MDEITVLYIKTMDGKATVPIIVDGDYDGEYFQDLSPFMRVIGAGYVQFYPSAIRNFGVPNYLHHMILPPKKGYWVTFKNGDKRDHRSSNLEYKTPSQVAQKREQAYVGDKRQVPRTHKLDAVTTSPYRGVRRDPRQNGEDRWYAFAQQKYLGQFGTPEAAARAYDTHARKTWGKRAILNFPEEEQT